MFPENSSAARGWRHWDAVGAELGGFSRLREFLCDVAQRFFGLSCGSRFFILLWLGFLWSGDCSDRTGVCVNL